MRLVTAIIAIVLFLPGCGKISSPLSPAPEFELREFVVTEEKTDATEYSKAYNSFKGTGTLMARNVSSDRNMLVWLEARDKTAGPNSEPQISAVLFRGGIGKVEVGKSKYGEMSVRPDYQWSVIGWQELNKATIQVAGAQPQ
jgi:hypothetical protein